MDDGERDGPDDLDCQDLVEMATAYLEGDLALAERRRLERHLTACDGCDAYLRQMRVTTRLTATLDAETDLSAPVRARLLDAYRAWRDGRPAPGESA